MATSMQGSISNMEVALSPARIPPSAKGVDGEQPYVPTDEDRAATINMLPSLDGEHTCDACAKDITGICFIRCAECRGAREQEHVDLCVDCFAAGREPLSHRNTHSYRVMDKLSERIFDEDWTAAEELSLIEQVRRHGLGAWETIADSKLFYRRKTASELCSHYLDTYLSRYGSVLPQFYLNHRGKGVSERVPIPFTGPDPHDPVLKGVKVDSREIRSRTIAELGTKPKFRYEPSWEALKKKKAAIKARDEAVKAAQVEAAAAARVTAANTRAAMGGGAVANGVSVGKALGAAGGGAALSLSGDRETLLEEAVDAAEAARGAATVAATTVAAAAEAGVDVDALGLGSETDGSTAGTSINSSLKVVQSRKRKRKQQQMSRNKEQERAIKDWVSSLPGADLSGYAPLRGDFEVEYDNAAEELLANMEFSKTDHPSERQLKLDVIAVYNHKLDERERRKRFVEEHNLLDYKKQPFGSKKRRKEDRELVARLRPFARFHTAERHDELIDNLLLAKKLRARIEQLQMYRAHGITTLTEAHEFENAKRRRQEELASEKHREAASHLYDAPANSKLNSRDRNNRYTSRNKDGVGGDAPDGNGESSEEAPGPDLMDLTDAPGVEYLAPAERQLCSELHLLPGYYLVVKDAMIQECARAGCLKRKNIANLAVMDGSRLNKMYDFFARCGWISDVPQQYEYEGSSNKQV